METDVICPDCGKVIAPPGAVENTLRCRCAEPKGPSVTADEVPLRPSVSVSVPMTATAASPPASPRSGKSPKSDPATVPSPDESATSKALREKNCYVCGTNLSGRTRLKDHLNRYWCKDCAKADERAKKRDEEGRCPDCGRVFPVDKLVFFQVTKVCKACFKQRERELEKKIKKAAAQRIHKTAEWQSIKWLSIAAGVLLLLGTIGYFMSR